MTFAPRESRGGRLLAWSLAGLAALAAWTSWQRARPPVRTDARTLWMSRDHWLDRRVEVEGVVERYAAGTDDEHYALEDGGFRVGLRGAEPDALSRLLGRRARAVGLFEFSESFGIYVQVERLDPAP